MKKLFKYILIIIALVGVFGTTEYANAQATGKCYWKLTNTEHSTITDQNRCSFNRVYWKPTAPVITPTAPVIRGTCYSKDASGKSVTYYGWEEQSCKNNNSSAKWEPSDMPKGVCVLPDNPIRNSGWSKMACDLSSGTWASSLDDFKYNFLAPLPCEDGMPGCVSGKLITFDPESKKGEANTNLGKYLNIMIRIIIGLSAVAAVAMIVIGGIQYMTSELMSSKEDGKNRMTNAILGLIIVLGSYALLYTINPDLLNSDVEIQDVTIYADLSADSTPQTPVNGKYTDRGGQVYDTANANSIDWVARAGQETPLPAGVTVLNPSKCIKVGQPSCTSIRGFSLAVINHILTNCRDCRTLSIQGATEFWLHGGSPRGTTHQIGSPTVDLGITNPALNSYIRSGQCSTDKWCQKDGMWYLDEGNHWHASGSSRS